MKFKEAGFQSATDPTYQNKDNCAFAMRPNLPEEAGPMDRDKRKPDGEDAARHVAISAFNWFLFYSSEINQHFCKRVKCLFSTSTYEQQFKTVSLALENIEINR